MKIKAGRLTIWQDASQSITRFYHQDEIQTRGTRDQTFLYVQRNIEDKIHFSAFLVFREKRNNLFQCFWFLEQTHAVYLSLVRSEQ